MTTDLVPLKQCSPSVQVGDKVIVRSGTYNRHGDNLGHAKGVVMSISGKRGMVKFGEEQRLKAQILLLEDLIPDKLAGTFFEYRCTKKKCSRAYWVKGIGPVDGMWLFGSSADFCDICGKGGPKRTGMVRVDGMIQRGEDVDTCIEEHTTTKTYDVKASVQCGSIGYYLWERGAAVGSPINPFEGLTKLEGEGGRLRITVKVEVLKKGKPAKPWHKRGCKACDIVKGMSPKAR